MTTSFRTFWAALIFGIAALIVFAITFEMGYRKGSEDAQRDNTVADRSAEEAVNKIWLKHNSAQNALS